MGLNVINWLSDIEYKIFIDSKEIEVQQLALTSKQKRMVAVILFIMPFLIGVVGVMTWLRQKVGRII